MTTDGSFTEEDLVTTAPERELLEGFLEYHRRVVGEKLRGLSEEDARRHLVPSSARSRSRLWRILTTRPGGVRCCTMPLMASSGAEPGRLTSYRKSGTGR
jgi:hypothetical protein